MSLTCIDLPRRDRSHRVRDIYSLNKIQQEFPNEYNDIYPIIKKVLLSSNYLFSHKKSKFLLYFIFNFVTVNIIILICISSYIQNNKDIKIQKLFHFLSYNLYFVPYWCVYYYKYKLKNFCILQLMYKISEFILENENKTNKKNIKFTLKENFTLQIEKSPSSTSQSTPMNLINYVINIPRDISNYNYYDKLLMLREKEIINDIIQYKNSKIKSVIVSLLNRYIIPLIIYACCVYYYKKTFDLNSLYIISSILFIGSCDFIHLKKNSIEDFKNFCIEKNESLIKEKYYIYISDFMISIVSIKDSLYYDLCEIKNTINRLFSNN